MKKTLLFLAIVLCIVACNKIEGPYVELSQQTAVDVVFPELDRSTVYRKILFDEYTGHMCIGCPEGHNIVDQMQLLFGDTIVPVAIHADFFAEPEAGLFSYDFRTIAGEQLYSAYHITNNPQAIINRSGNPLEKSTWISEMQNADRSLYAAIQIINQFNEIDYSLKINTKTTMLTDYDNEVQLSLLLIENNIMQPQKFSDHVDTFYIHDHVLRYGINGTYGEYISPNGLVSKDSSYLYGYTVDFNGHDWWPDACRVVAILLDRDTKKVLQVEEALVK